MKLKEVCEATGLTRKTIRLYEEKGLLVPQKEARNGREYREYSQEDVETLREIATLRRAWFTMDEISRMQQDPETIREIFPQYLQWLEAQQQTLRQLLTAARAIDPQQVKSVAELSWKMKEAEKMPLPQTDVKPKFRYLDAQEKRPPRVSIQDTMLLMDGKPLLWPWVYKTRSQMMMDETRKVLDGENLPVGEREPEKEPLWLRIVQVPITAVTFCSFGVATFYAMGMRFLWQAWLILAISGGLWALIAYARWKREQDKWVRKMGWKQDEEKDCKNEHT